jgi:hypothetical protein
MQWSPALGLPLLLTAVAAGGVVVLLRVPAPRAVADCP